MYNADRVRETTTTTGTGTITLAGASTQHQTFTSRVQTGDPCAYCILDANGTAWEVGEGTMATSSTLSRDTIYQSSNSDAALTLTTGTHTVFLTFAADKQNKNAIMGDFFVDHVVSGLVPPTSANLTSIMTAGTAYVVGQRIRKGAQSKTYTASKDTYVDLSNTGVLTYAEVTNGAGAPALTANSIRLAKVVTSGSAVTSVTTTGFDSLANPIHINIRTPFAKVRTSGTTSYANGTTFIAFGSGTTLFNNDSMHSENTNTSRLTIQHGGLYQFSGMFEIISTVAAATHYLNVCKNGVSGGITGGSVSLIATAAGQFPILNVSCQDYAVPGDYYQLEFSNGDASAETGGNEVFSAARIG